MRPTKPVSPLFGLFALGRQLAKRLSDHTGSICTGRPYKGASALGVVIVRVLRDDLFEVLHGLLDLSLHHATLAGPE